MNRYNRHIILSEIGQEGQDKLLKAKVLVIGAGGLGCPILQYLAAAGIGTIGIVDFDVVDITNLQRQILFGTSTIGENKALAAKKRLSDLNDSITINVYPEQLTHKNVLTLFQAYDIIVDGTDNFETRYLINDACIITQKPLVYGAIYKFEGQVSVFNFQNGPSYRCLFPEAPEKNTVPNCSEIGVLGVLPGIIGTMQANEVLKLILGIGESLSGKLLCYNALNLNITLLNISRNNNLIDDVLKGKDTFHLKTTASFCAAPHETTSFKNLLNRNDLQFIDVREAHETPKIKGLEYTNIPLSQLENNLERLNRNKEIILFCQSGIRSKKAVSILQKLHIENCTSLKEGASEILQIINSKSIKNDR
ncbi:HesA/MoeB/ThiF family protein [Aestuariibaculum sediminum]|uniref:Molybdopterin-synthase adenylyltransferase n=1 Tax=Aestuariibaculum sediminum TaxID=2770637 RepID=A0A8J6U977_9FLAO|nr:HesA/MoeB/ThiF family protein [Aestuariibaculum sediminum]MBD0832742.1 HesA/MoeB/ThiF family protein [Aestuariibaculum sediminum]